MKILPARTTSWLAVVCGLGFALVLGACERREDAAVTPASGTSPVAAPSGTPTTLPQAELAATFDKLTGLIAEARTDDIWQKFRAMQQASIAIANNQMTVTATGDRPSLILPPFAANRRLILQVVMDSPADTMAQLFYMAAGQTNYSDAQSQIVPVQRGRNVIYFRLDAPGLMDPVRFDPGTVPGVYTFESMTARGLAPGQ